MNIEINDYDWAGETMTVQYFLDNEEHYLDIEHSDLLQHVEENELNVGWAWGATEEDGAREQVDNHEEPTAWLEDRSNQKTALESYLKYFHKSKSY